MSTDQSAARTLIVIELKSGNESRINSHEDPLFLAQHINEGFKLPVLGFRDVDDIWVFINTQEIERITLYPEGGLK